ncbi:MAG: hypothetical protein KME17_11580 [Cyanosarcina radialis HA8281-LM2]|jgi:hypothetical protein|nr:hypothetical protein [Cyanosarcina radialis HA8281-LM2]
MKTLQFIVSVSLLLVGCSSGVISVAPPPPQEVEIDSRSTKIKLVNRSQIPTKVKCVTWSQFQQAVRDRKISLNQPVPDLPQGYRQGCVLADRGVYTLVLYIFKDGFDIDRLPVNRQVLASERYQQAIIPPLDTFYSLPRSDLKVKEYMRIGFDRLDRPNSLDLNKPDNWKTWERPYVSFQKDIFYRTIFVDKLDSDRSIQEMVDLLAATRDRWPAETPFSSRSTAITDKSTCKLKGYNTHAKWGEPIYESNLIITVTNRSSIAKNIILIEMDTFDEHGNKIRMENGLRRFQKWIFFLEPPLQVGETRDIEASGRKYIVWHKIDLKHCQWLNSIGGYFAIYPEVKTTSPLRAP